MNNFEEIYTGKNKKTSPKYYFYRILGVFEDLLLTDFGFSHKSSKTWFKLTIQIDAFNFQAVF